MSKNFSDLLRGLKPVILILVVQAALGGVIVFYKLAVIYGMSVRVLVAYRFIFATACVIPLALILERKSKAKLTWKIVFQGFLSGLFGGALGPNLFIASLSLTSATFATAVSNLVPVATLILAVILRLESLGIRKLAGQAKLVGIFLSIGGAMILTFYKGEEINLWSTNINLAKHGADHATRKHALLGNQVLGSLLALAACVSFAIWYIIQAKISENYPYIYSSTVLMCIAASVQATIYTIIAERNWSAWKLGWNIRLLSAVYTGAIGTALTVVLMTWCLRLRGPLFVSIFNPFTLVFVAIVGSLILNERLNTGSILGSVLIVIGVYVVLWGKAKEMKHSTHLALQEYPAESEAVDVVISSLQETHQICDTNKESHPS
ncbi:PREDICTED: WAT1-related protein At1g25270 [Theobroma cacao]|uniref:WAT1-related protein n=1 Tax=Theobroma cacao TaxID=3641 RepID=A0AB32VKI0_THECC|nr:PREDICTED: WAT1-related protein At1g25270 [Theobroma cacao]